MDYKTQMRVALMKGTAHRTKGQGISFVGLRPLMERMDAANIIGRGPQMSGTISHRVIRDLVEPLSESINDLSIKKNQRARSSQKKNI
jgi:hypothetical protein